MTPKVGEASQNFAQTTHCFHALIKPLETSLEIFGLYFEKPEAESHLRCFYLRKAYCIITLSILWVNLLRYIPAFFVGFDFREDILVLRIIVFVWCILGTLNATILFYGCHGHVTNFCNVLSCMKRSEACLSLHIDKRPKYQKVRRKVFIWTAVAWTVFFTNTLAIILLTFGPSKQTRDTLGVCLSNPAPSTTLFKCIGMFLTIYNTAAWIFPLIYQIITFESIGSEFEIVTDALITKLKESDRGFPSDLEGLRKVHKDLGHAVSCMDKVVSLWIMAAYITNLPASCFLLYTMVNGNVDGISLTIYIFWFISNLVYAFTVSLASSNLMNKAHAPLEHIYDVSVKGATPEEIADLNLFISKLTGPPIGFTALGLITVTKEVILTLAGLFLTYFFLLVQFKI